MTPVPSSRCLERLERSSSHTIFLHKTILEVPVMNCLQNTFTFQGRKAMTWLYSCVWLCSMWGYVRLHTQARTITYNRLLSFLDVLGKSSPVPHLPPPISSTAKLGHRWLASCQGRQTNFNLLLMSNITSKVSLVGVRDGEREGNTEHFLKPASMNEEASEASF